MGGHVILNGEDITEASERRMREIRGGEIGIIFLGKLPRYSPLYCAQQNGKYSLNIHAHIFFAFYAHFYKSSPLLRLGIIINILYFLVGLTVGLGCTILDLPNFLISFKNCKIKGDSVICCVSSSIYIGN